jgi:hypothetical protein
MDAARVRINHGLFSLLLARCHCGYFTVVEFSATSNEVAAALEVTDGKKLKS